MSEAHTVEVTGPAVEGQDEILTPDALQFHAAIEVYTRALAIAPEDVRLLRFRGHRYISTRRFDLAAADLRRAAGLVPSSFDVLYHLGLAHYLSGDFDEAARVYRSCLETTSDPRPLPQGWRSCATTRGSSTRAT